MAHKKTAATMKLLGVWSLYKESSPGVRAAENLFTAGLLEVDFVGLKVGEVGKPMIVGDTNPKFHDSPFIAAFNIYYSILGYFILKIPVYQISYFTISLNKGLEIGNMASI